jgi:hypothetical protein
MRIKRVVIAIAAMLALMAVCSFAQDHAKPRGDGGRRDGAQAHRDGQRGRQAEQPPPRAERQPEHRAQGQEANRSGGQSQAERRHPQPGVHPNRLQPYHYRDYQNEFHGWYRFPRNYEGNGRYLHRYYRHQLMRPHFRGWLPEMNLYFFWPFYDQPVPGCGWYWVPTVQVPELDPAGNVVAYRYYRWRYVYLCIEGDRLGW